MEPSNDTEIHQPESVTEKEDTNFQLRSQEPDSGIISVQFLEFKTSLLEAVEELHIHRDAEIRYEAQICKLVLEKQELEWQKESLQNQIDRMTNEYSESLAAVKKQCQAQVRGTEEEKGKHQLTAELKDKEITSLKEELKLLQLFKYSLEKKLSELEQKLQLQTQVKDQHLNQLGEVEKRFGIVTRQCALVKQAHEKLEQNVEEAMRINKKLTSINKKQESTIATLKLDMEKLNSEMVRYKVVSTCRSGEESSNFLLKEQQLQELKQRLIVETELNKRLRNENAVERAEKQKLMSSLQHAQELLQTQTRAVCRTEQQLLIHTEKCQVLKREHEMIQERSKEKEDRLMRVIEEYKNSKLSLEKEMQMLQARVEADQKELKAVNEAYQHLHEKHLQLSCAMSQAKNMHGLENDLKASLNIQKDSPCSLKGDIHLNLAGNLCKDESLDTEVGQVSPQNDCEQMRHCKEVEDIPDERTFECQEVAKDDCLYEENGEVNACSQTDRTVLPPSHALDALAPDQTLRRENISGADVLVTHSDIDPVVKKKSCVIESTCDNACPLSVSQSYTDNCLARLSELETRSVYGGASDPLMFESRDRPVEQSLGVSEMRVHQTSDKHTSETSQDSDLKEVEPHTTAPDTNSPQNVSPNNSTDGSKLQEESESSPPLQNKNALNNNPSRHEELDLSHSSSPQRIPVSHDEQTLPWTASFSDRESDSTFSQLQAASSSKYGSLMHQGTNVSKKTEATEANSIPKAECEAVVSSLSHSTVDITVNLSEAAQRNEMEENCAVATSAQIIREQEKAHVSSSSLISNPQKDALSIARLTEQEGQIKDTEKQMNNDEHSYLDDREKYGSSFVPSMIQKETLDMQLKRPRSFTGPVKNQNKSTSSRSLVLEQKSALSSGFQELLTTLNTPLFKKHKLKGASVITQHFDKLNSSSIHPDQKSDHHVEWNAIQQTFSEISVKKVSFMCRQEKAMENKVPIYFGSAQLGSPAAQSVGNGLRHGCTPTPPPRLHGLGKVSQPVPEESMPTPLEKEGHHGSDIRTQIAQIELFLSSEGFRPEKRRRTEKYMN